jgi:hypothetical protein
MPPLRAPLGKPAFCLVPFRPIAQQHLLVIKAVLVDAFLHYRPERLYLSAIVRRLCIPEGFVERLGLCISAGLLVYVLVREFTKAVYEYLAISRTHRFSETITRKVANCEDPRCHNHADILARAVDAGSQ